MTNRAVFDYPTDIELEAEDQARLKKMNDDMIACRQFVATVQEQGEARLSQLQGVMRDTWQEIGKKYSLELSEASYELSEDATKLVLKSVRHV